MVGQSLFGKKVLIIDDDVDLGRVVETVFQMEDAETFLAHDGRSGLQMFFEIRPDLVISDVLMPGLDGWEVCRQIRRLSQTPIIMLTTESGDRNTVKGLELGADDYVSKPFTSDVLLARSRALLRRARMAAPKPGALAYRDYYLVIDLVNREIIAGGKHVKLTPTEYDLLAYLVRHGNHIRTYRQILENVWGFAYQDQIDYVQVYVSHLRRKLERDPRNPEYIVTEHGVGYRFARQ